MELLYLYVYLHHGYSGVYFRGQREVYFVFVPVPYTHSHALLDILRGERSVEINHKLSELFNIDYVFGFLCVGVYYFSASSHLKWFSGL